MLTTAAHLDRAADEAGLALDAARAAKAAFLQAVIDLIGQQPVATDEQSRKLALGYAIDMAADLFHDEIERLEEACGEAELARDGEYERQQFSDYYARRL